MDDQGLRALLAIEPSPEFKAGVRARLQAPRPRPWRDLLTVRRLGLSTAAIVAVVVAIGLRDQLDVVSHTEPPALDATHRAHSTFANLAPALVAEHTRAADGHGSLTLQSMGGSTVA